VFGFRRDQTERAVPGGIALVVMVVMMVMMVMVSVDRVALPVVLDELEQPRGLVVGGRGGRRRSGRRTAVVRHGNGAAAAATAGHGGHGGRSRRRRRRRRGETRADGRRRRPLDRHAEVDRRGHGDFHRATAV